MEHIDCPDMEELQEGFWPSPHDYLFHEDLKHGIIRLHDELNNFTARILIQKLSVMVRRGLKEVDFYITSPGGTVYDALAVYDYIRILEKEGVQVRGIVLGYAASAASMILLQACSRRQASPNTRFLIHECRSWMGTEEKTSSLKDHLEEMNNLEGLVVSILAQRTNRTAEEVERAISRREHWMSAEEAQRWGLIDEIL